MKFIYKGIEYLIKDYKINKDIVTIRFGGFIRTISLEDWNKING
jgi:hypothetical protein